MKRQSISILSLLTCAFVVGLVSAAAAQQAESQLSLVTSVHVKPGMVQQYETARKQAVENRTEGRFPFLERASVSESGVYRYSSPLGGWEDFQTRQDWFQPPIPSFVPSLREATDHTDSRIMRTRPELSYVPDNLRVPFTDVGFIHEVRLYLRPGAGGAVGEVMEEITALNERHDIPDARLVSSQVTGSDGPMVTLTFFGRDAADYYAQTAKNFEMMGQELQALIGRVMANCRRVEQENFTIRRDLRFDPE